MSQGSVFYVAVNLHVHRLSSKWLQFVTFWFVKLTIWRENNVSCSVARGLNISSTFLIKQEIGTHVQYTQTDTNRQETLTNGTVGKISPLVKEALWFAPLVRMESSSVHWYTSGKLHLITTWEPCVIVYEMYCLPNIYSNANQSAHALRANCFNLFVRK